MGCVCGPCAPRRWLPAPGRVNRSTRGARQRDLAHVTRRCTPGPGSAPAAPRRHPPARHSTPRRPAPPVCRSSARSWCRTPLPRADRILPVRTGTGREPRRSRAQDLLFPAHATPDPHGASTVGRDRWTAPTAPTLARLVLPKDERRRLAAGRPHPASDSATHIWTPQNRSLPSPRTGQPPPQRHPAAQLTQAEQPMAQEP